MIVRPLAMCERDLAGLTKLMNQWDDLPGDIPPAYIADKVKRISETNLCTAILLAEEGDEIIAYAYLTEVIFIGLTPLIELQSILVDAAYRRRGAATLLMIESEKWAKRQGFEKIMLSSRTHLHNAHALYERMGYTLAKQSFFFTKKI